MTMKLFWLVKTKTSYVRLEYIERSMIDHVEFIVESVYTMHDNEVEYMTHDNEAPLTLKP